MKLKVFLQTMTLLALSATLMACAHHGKKCHRCKKGQHGKHKSHKMGSCPMNGNFVAVLEPTKNGKCNGTIRFTCLGNGVKVAGQVNGLEPDSRHGFHIHEFGDISADDGTRAGGHFNPKDTKHGLPGSKKTHAGDLGNIKANKDGVATVEKESKKLKMGGPWGILGRAVVVHAKPDKGIQPTGAAGPRACVGVIGRAK